MKKFSVVASLIFLVAGFAQVSLADKIVVAGTGDSQELLRVLAADYEKSHPGTSIEVPESIGSSGGVKALVKGACDLARIARPLQEKEMALGLSKQDFAISPVVIAVNSSVKKIKNLTSAQLVGIYSGTVTDWKELGGLPGKIFVANREAGDSSRSAFERHISGFAEIKEPAGRILYSTPEAVEAIGRYANTIGYGPLAMVRPAELKVVDLDGVSASRENVLSGRYPLSATFSLVWQGELRGLAKSFVAYLDSPEARAIITTQGAYPLTRNKN